MMDDYAVDSRGHSRFFNERFTNTARSTVPCYALFVLIPASLASLSPLSSCMLSYENAKPFISGIPPKTRAWNPPCNLSTPTLDRRVDAERSVHHQRLHVTICATSQHRPRSSTSPTKSQNGAIRHVPLPVRRTLHILRQVTIRRKRHRQILHHTLLTHALRAHRPQKPNDRARKVIQEHQVHGRGDTAIRRETRVRLEVVRLAVVRDATVDGVVAVGPEVVGGGVARRGLAQTAGLAATDAAEAAFGVGIGCMDRGRIGTGLARVEEDAGCGCEGRVCGVELRLRFG